MLEYHAHTASLNAATKAILNIDEPDLAGAIADAADAADQHPDIAKLGSLLDILLGFADSNELELVLLRRAAELWQRGLSTYRELDTARIEFELSLVRTDLPDALDVLQMGMVRYYDVSLEVGRIVQEAKALRDALAPLDHIAAHPRQSDLNSAQWSWGDAFVGRRTLALVQGLFDNAADSRGRALAVGALGGYAGNVAGSAFLGSVVGGPRRLHRYRDRLARNTLGTWMRVNAGAESPGELREVLMLGRHEEAPALPPDLAGLLHAALSQAYPSRALPDLELGYRRMLEHLDLLGQFTMPDPPEPPIIPLSGDMVGGVFDDGISEPGEPAGPTAGGPPDVFGPSVTVPFDETGQASSNKSVGDFCLGALIVLGVITGVGLIIFGVWCIARKISGEDCDPGLFSDEANPPPDPRDSQATQEGLTILRKPENAGEVLQNVFQLSMRLWQAFEAARAYLTVSGLIYPAHETLDQPLQKQFLRSRETSIWPRREDANAADTYHEYPDTPAEGPAMEPFPPDRTPDWLLQPYNVDSVFTVGQVATEAFRSLHDLDPQFNLDADADRGYRHPCWNVSQATSINDNPLSVDLLLFDEE